MATDQPATAAPRAWKRLICGCFDVCEHGEICRCPSCRAAIPGEDGRVSEHLFHMTDGRWHDSCFYCIQRREHGGSGVDRAE